MARPEIIDKGPKTSSTRAQRKSGPGAPNTTDVTTSSTPTAVFSIKSFCIAHGISEAFYFKLREQGHGPREMRLGSRVFITHESAARWRIEREAATAA